MGAHKNNLNGESQLLIYNSPLIDWLIIIANIGDMNISNMPIFEIIIFSSFKLFFFIKNITEPIKVMNNIILVPCLTLMNSNGIKINQNLKKLSVVNNVNLLFIF